MEFNNFTYDPVEDTFHINDGRFHIFRRQFSQQIYFCPHGKPEALRVWDLVSYENSGANIDKEEYLKRELGIIDEKIALVMANEDKLYDAFQILNQTKFYEDMRV